MTWSALLAIADAPAAPVGLAPVVGAATGVPIGVAWACCSGEAPVTRLRTVVPIE